MFDLPLGEHNFELDVVIYFFTHCLLDIFDHPVSILWMDSLQHCFAVRKTLLRIEAPNSEIFLRPIDRLVTIERPTAGMAQPLRFGQISFTSLKSFVCQ